MNKIIDDEVKILGLARWKLRHLWFPMILVLVIYLSWVMAIKPRIDEVFEFQRNTESTNKKTVEINEKRNYLLSANEEDLKLKENTLSSALPVKKDVYYLLTVVQNIASQYGYSVDSFSVSPGKLETESADTKTLKVGSDVLKKIPVVITLSGLQSNFLPLVDTIESSLPILSIDAFKMSQNSGGVKLDLTVATFFSSDKFDIKVGNLTLADLTLTKDELATLNRLSTFKVTTDINSLTASESGKNYIRYDRVDPFSF